MILRAYGIVVSGSLEIGLELVIEGGAVSEIRPHTGIPEPFVVSVPFVNAHSHLEYRGLQGKVHETEFWPWIREITKLKGLQGIEGIAQAAKLAATENWATGVGFIGEHSDRPVAGAALRGMPGLVFQETITFFEQQSPAEKLDAVRANLKANRAASDGLLEFFQSPHSVYTVDRDTLRALGASQDPISFHLAETPAESQFTRDGTGPIAEFFRSHGFASEPTGLSVFETASEYGLIRNGAQLVHCCDLSNSEIDALATSGATVAHCPRSNHSLGCPPAPMREMLDAGIVVGLGLDSPASSGPIDMFAEMRAALLVSRNRGRLLSAEEVWRMATVDGARSLWKGGWDLRAGWTGPLIAIQVDGARSVVEVIMRGAPAKVRLLTTDD